MVNHSREVHRNRSEVVHPNFGLISLWIYGFGNLIFCVGGANLMNISPSWNTLEISGLLFTKRPLGWYHVASSSLLWPRSFVFNKMPCFSEWDWKTDAHIILFRICSYKRPKIYTPTFGCSDAPFSIVAAKMGRNVNHLTPDHLILICTPEMQDILGQFGRTCPT